MTAVPSARAGRQGLDGTAPRRRNHAFDDGSRRTSGIDPGRQGQHRERADAPRFTGGTVLISKMITLVVIEVAVPIGDVGDAIVRQGATLGYRHPPARRRW
jgi:hypothetical protein